MTIFHHGDQIPRFPERWDPDDIEYVWICWTDKLNGASISTSTWFLPSSWDNGGEQTNQTVTDDEGVARAACNGVLASTTATTGEHIITNEVTLSDGRQYQRSVLVRVEDI